MTDTAHSPDHSASGQLDNETVDETIEYVPNRRVVVTAGKCARAEQERLEKELGLQDGRTPRPD